MATTMMGCYLLEWWVVGGVFCDCLWWVSKGLEKGDGKAKDISTKIRSV